MSKCKNAEDIVLSVEHPSRKQIQSVLGPASTLW